MRDPAVQSPPAPAQPGQLATRVRHWVMVFAVALAVITYIDRVAISWAAPYIQHDLSLDSAQMGWVFAAFTWAYAIFEIPGGFLGDWIGPRKVLIRVVLWWSFFTAATGWARGLTTLTVTRFLFGAGEAGCFPNITKIFSVWLPAKEKARAQGIVWMAARWGGAFTPPLVSFVVLQVGWRHAFELFGLIGPVWAILFYLWFRDNPMDHPGLNQAERDLVSASSKLAAGHADVPWLRLLKSGRVWLLCWQYFCLTYGWYFYITWLPTYLRNGRHLEIASSAMLSMLPLFLGGLANPISVFLGERLDQMDSRRCPHAADCVLLRIRGRMSVSVWFHAGGESRAGRAGHCHGEFLWRSDHAARLGGGHGHGRQVRRDSFRRDELVGEFRRRDLADGDRLRVAVDRQQLEPDVLRRLRGVRLRHPVLAVSGFDDAD